VTSKPLSEIQILIEDRIVGSGECGQSSREYRCHLAICTPNGAQRLASLSAVGTPNTMRIEVTGSLIADVQRLLAK